MPTSQNGFPANDRSHVRSAFVDGTDVKVAVRRGPAGDLLLYVAARWHREVEPLRAADGVLDCWGYAERKIRGSSTTLSNHASGTALDFRARIHPLGRTGTYNAAQAKAIRRILADCRGAIRWGGDYTGRRDEMHVEVIVTEAACGRVLQGLASHQLPTLRFDDRSEAVRRLQEFLLSTFPGYVDFTPTGYYGPATRDAVAEFQHRVAITGPDADGTVVGPRTNAALAKYGYRR